MTFSSQPMRRKAFTNWKTHWGIFRYLLPSMPISKAFKEKTVQLLVVYSTSTKIRHPETGQRWRPNWVLAPNVSARNATNW